MKKAVGLSAIVFVALSLQPTVALANVSGTVYGYGVTQQGAVGNGQLAVNNACSPYGGVQTSKLIQLFYESTHWKSVYSYTCNQ